MDLGTRIIRSQFWPWIFEKPAMTCEELALLIQDPPENTPHRCRFVLKRTRINLDVFIARVLCSCSGIENESLRVFLLVEEVDIPTFLHIAEMWLLPITNSLCPLPWDDIDPLEGNARISWSSIEHTWREFVLEGSPT